MDKEKLWERAVDFHGHACGGLMIGYKAAIYAMELLNLEYSDDEEIVCIAENDTCAVDAIQAVLGCSIGKGNLLFHMRGKYVFTIYDRTTGKGVRLALESKEERDDLDDEQYFLYYKAKTPEDMFTVTEPRLPLPEHARMFDTYRCSICREDAGANWIRMVDGKPVCLDCCGNYNRFEV